MSHAAAPQRPAPEYWSFKGSIFNSIAEGELRKIFYLKPHPDAEATGVQRGTLFVEGKMLTFAAGALNRRFVGLAYHYDPRCGRIPYRVDGTIPDGNRRLELQGQKPRVHANCKDIGTELASLTLKSVDPGVAATIEATTEKPVVEGCGREARGGG